MNTQNQLTNTDGWPRWLWRFVRRFSGIEIFDAETNDTLSVGCPTAEEQAEIRYGAHWREEYAAKRAAERRKQWPVLHGLLPPNGPRETRSGENGGGSVLGQCLRVKRKDA